MKTFRDFQVFDFIYRAKSKTRKPRKLTFFLLKPRRNVNVFSYRLFFRFWVSYTTKNLSKIKLYETSKFSILGIGQNRKLRKLENWYLFLIKPYCNVIVSFFLRYFLVFRSSTSYTTKHWSKIGTALNQTVNLQQQHLQFSVTEVFKDASRKYSKLRLNLQFKWFFLYL